MINGTQDTAVPRAAVMRLYEAAKEPKQILWAEAGHDLPAPVTFTGVEWLAEKLGRPPHSHRASGTALN
jgi:fermentation-respiration switch protein FrsA (DUF1100 family)